jgi:hypothetical protein
MRWSLYLLVVIIGSCTTYSREKQQQHTIDSLANEIKKRDSVEKEEATPIKQELRDGVLPIVIVKNDEEGKINDVKKKEQPVNAITEKTGSVDVISKENNIANAEQENGDHINERNSVLKKVLIEKPTFKPLLFGGFKDIKFNFYNNYDYKLEEAILKVHYIRADGSEIKSETKILKDISPHSKLALTAPDHTQSGKEIKITLEAVHCHAIDLCFYSTEAGRSGDPYKCR